MLTLDWHVSRLQRVSRQVSAGFMEMLREEEAAVEAGESWARLSARLQTDPRFQVMHLNPKPRLQGSLR